MRTVTPASDSGPPTSVQFLHVVLRFARVARYRWTMLAAVMIGFGFLGTLYYATADRVYEARAQLLVQQTGPIVTSIGTTDGLTQQGMLPTYERLFVSTVVLEGAVQRLQQLPREMRADLIDTPQENWIAQLRGQIAVRSIRLTNVLEISYRSQSPVAAEAVVQALVDSYMQFMRSNHQTVAEELVTILKSERLGVEQQLRHKEEELLAAKRKFGDLGLRESTQTLHPLVQRVVSINESLIQVQQDRLKMQATLAAVQEARTQGADLRQHLIAVEPVIGREVVLAALGLSDQDEQTVARLERQLIEDRAELGSLVAHYGDRHPKVQRLGDAIEETRNYLANYQQEVDRRSDLLQQRQLATMLPKLLTQELSKARAQEAYLEKQYERAQQEAVALQGRFEEIAMLQREVDRLLNFNHTLLDHINNIDINQNQSDVRVEVVSRPQASKQPVAPRLIVVLFVSLFGGSLLGVASVYIVDVLDDRFRSLDEMKVQLQTPILAMIRQLEPHQESGLDALQVHVAPDAVESEAFRTLRTTVAFSGEDLECVAISSSEPGDGKTTVAANLGLSFAQTGRRTLLIDADLRRPGLTRLFELKGQPGLTELLRDDEPLATRTARSIYRVADEGLDVMPSGTRPLDPTGLLSSTRFAELLSWATAHYDQVLIDCPPILVASDAARRRPHGRWSDARRPTSEKSSPTGCPCHRRSPFRRTEPDWCHPESLDSGRSTRLLRGRVWLRLWIWLRPRLRVRSRTATWRGSRWRTAWRRNIRRRTPRWRSAAGGQEAAGTTGSALGQRGAAAASSVGTRRPTS
jgi:polysaccharide biosynthesis transport protein